MATFLEYKKVTPLNIICLFLLGIFVLVGLDRGAGKISSFFEPVLGGFAVYLLVTGKASRIKVDPWLVAVFFCYCFYYLLRWQGWTGPLDVSVDYFRPVMQAILMISLLAWVVANQHFSRGWGASFVVAGAVIAIISIVNFYLVLGHAWHVRIRPLGEAEHPILGMYYYAFPLILAGVLMLQARSQKQKAFFLFCIVAIFSVFIFSGSRGPLLGLVSTLLVFLFFMASGWKRWVLPLITIGAVAGFLLFMDEAWLARLDTGRFIIWNAVLEAVPKELWFGHGSTGDNYVYFSDTYGWQHAHNIWLGHLFWGGGAAALLLGGVYCRVAWLLIMYRRNAVSALGLALLCFGLISMLTDGNLLLGSPGPMWVVFVVPVGLALGLSASDKGELHWAGV